MADTKEIIHTLSNKVFNLQDKLMDIEYKEILEDLAKLYFSVENNNSNYCNCDYFNYNCYSHNRFHICTFKNNILEICPLLERLFYVIYNRYNYLNINIPYTPLNKYKIMIQPIFLETINITNNLKVIRFIDELIKFINQNYNNTNNFLFFKSLAYLCYIFSILKNINVLNQIYNSGEILNEILLFINDTNNLQILKDNQIDTLIDDNIDCVFENYKMCFNKMKKDYDETNRILSFNSPKRNPINTNKQQINYVVNRHPMSSRRQCNFTYKRKFTTQINDREVITYNIGDKCKIKCINRNHFCERHMPK